MASNNDSKRVVPWISMEEWKQVYQNVYSPNIKDRWEGLQRMLVWKSRVDKLTVGVECSLYLLQAVLRDEELKENLENTLLETDVKLMYSTAIIRFINLISHLGQVEVRHQAITAIAEMVGIPDWVVNIRHAATHSNMPSLEVLRPGAELAMEWLQENYWRTEEENSYELYWPESKRGTARMLRAKKIMAEEEKLSGTAMNYELISEELYVAVSMLVTLLKEMPRCQIMMELESDALRMYAYELWAQAKELAKPMSKREIDHLRVPLRKLFKLLQADVERILSEWVDSDSVEVEMQKGKCLVSAICQCPDLLTESKFGSTFSDLLPLWKQVQAWNSMTYLLDKLPAKEVDNETQRLVLTKLLANFADALISAKSNPKSSALKFNEELEAIDWRRIVRKVLEEPNAETLNAVSKLFRLHDPPVANEKQKQVAELLQVYLGNNEEPEPDNPLSRSSKMFTVNMLQSPRKQTPRERAILSPSSRKDNNNQNPLNGSVQTISSWTLCTEYDWSTIPIGSLPDNKCDATELELTGVEWQLIDAESDSETDELTASKKRTGERFDWDSLMRKRRRRGGLTKDVPLE